MTSLNSAGDVITMATLVFWTAIFITLLEAVSMEHAWGRLAAALLWLYTAFSIIVTLAVAISYAAWLQEVVVECGSTYQTFRSKLFDDDGAYQFVAIHVVFGALVMGLVYTTSHM